MSIKNLDDTQQSTNEQPANTTSEDRSFAISRRNVMQTGAAAVAATAVSYAPPLVRMARASGALSPGPFFNNVTSVGGATVIQNGSSFDVTDLGSGNPPTAGVNLGLAPGTGANVTANGAKFQTSPIDLSATDAEFTYDACEFFGSAVVPATRVGCRNIAGNITLSFDLNVSPLFCMDVTVRFRNSAGATIGVQTCPAGALATVTPSGGAGPTPQIISLGVEPGDTCLTVGLSNAARFTSVAGHPAPFVIDGVSTVCLSPATCSVFPTLAPVDCFECLGSNMGGFSVSG